MNKPAAKEPSMDEILSSIRQIIADDDAALAPEPPAQTEEPAGLGGGLPSFDAFLAEEETDGAIEPDFPSEAVAPLEMDFASAGRADADAEDALALSLDQVVDDSAEADDETSADRDYALPDDVAFVASDHIDLDVAPPSLRRNDDRSQFGAMPDMALSADLADHLLDSTTQVAAREAFSRLGGMAIGGGGQTVEGVVREMLRPMLKSWLDENLPSIVERLVEREIERVSRGGR